MGPRSSSSWFEAKELTPGVFGIAEPGHFEEVISYLWVHPERSILIDSGMGFFSMRKFVRTLTDSPITLLNTHSHFDHVGGNFEFDDIAIFDHADARQVVTHGKSAESLRKWITADQLWGSVPAGMPDPYVIHPFPHARFFQDGEVLTFGSDTIEILHTPGHSDDSVCFFSCKHGYLFCGDLLYDGPLFIQRHGGLRKFRSSIDKLLSLRDLKTLFPAHNSFEFPLSKLKQVHEAIVKITTEDLETEILIDGRLRLVPY